MDGAGRKLMKKKFPFLQRKLREQALGRFAPEYNAAFGFGADASDEYYLRLPFRRSLPAILISAAFLAVFSYPLFAMGGMFAGSSDDSLFSLVSILFTLFWMLGWSTGVLVLLLAFLCLSFGRESLHVAENKLIMRIGIPGIALSATYNDELIRNFHYRDREIADGKKWRGKHIAFDYGDVTISFGSNIDALEATRMISQLNTMFPMHGAAPVELDKFVVPQSEVVEEKDGEAVRSGIVAIEDASPVRWNSLSSITLILANVIPLFGVWLAGWDIGQIMLLFWAESAIIGYYNLCKMWKVGRWSLLFFGPFFVGHYGAFMAVHLLFIYALFGGEMAGSAEISTTQVYSDMQALWPALLGLLISHGISYYINFVKSNKSDGRTMALQMQEPYRRVMIMHMTLIIGGFLALALGTSIAALMLLLVLKIVADLRSHLSQHSS